jgi:hypothetical protein
MKTRKAVALLFAALLLILGWRVYAPVSRYLSDSAPMLRLKLRRTFKSLPKPPVGVTPLAQYQISEGGSDCSAFAVEEVYGADVSLESIVHYYETELAAAGWVELRGYSPQNYTYTLATFERQRGEYLWLLSKEWLPFSLCPPDVELMLKQETQFQAFYFLHVGRTCQYASP